MEEQVISIPNRPVCDACEEHYANAVVAAEHISNRTRKVMYLCACQDCMQAAVFALTINGFKAVSVIVTDNEGKVLEARAAWTEVEA